MSRNEKQKPLSKDGWDNWDKIFGKKDKEKGAD